jgi:poly(U)-specific endoribonuclease
MYNLRVPGRCNSPKKYELKLAPSFNLDVNLNEAVQELWNLDVNRLTPGADFVMNVQGGKKPYQKEDDASEPLFTSVDKSVWNRPTYKTFYALLNNFKAETGEAEVVSDVERQEVQAFLQAIGQTAPIQFCHKYCHSKLGNKVPSDMAGFLKLLHEIWFELYNRERGGKKDSSGFEHVFVGEVKNGEVSGFHNWIQFYLEEQKGALDYRGYIKPRSNSDSLSDSNDHVLSLQFRWNDVEKFVGTSFIGVSPEFEVALYTTIFLLGEEEEHVELNTGTDVFGLKIRCYKMAQNKVGTSFPEATSHHD